MFMFRPPMNTDWLTTDTIFTLSSLPLNRYQEKKQNGEIPQFTIKSLPPSQREKLRESWRNAQEKKEIYKLSKHDALRARRSAVFRVQHSLACGDAV